MKKIAVAVIALLVVACLANGCAGKYADVKKAHADYAKKTDAYIAELAEVHDAKAAATAINNYADALETVWPQMQAVSEKYPELQDRENPPKELESSWKESAAAGQKMSDTFMKLMPYMSDPDVKKAQERLMGIMRSSR